jgi:hypothetical protein
LAGGWEKAAGTSLVLSLRRQEAVVKDFIEFQGDSIKSRVQHNQGLQQDKRKNGQPAVTPKSGRISRRIDYGINSGDRFMANTRRRYSKEELARRGDAIYEENVRPQVHADDEGKFAAIDIESGEFAVDADELKACRKLRKRAPDAQIWMVRIGYRSVHRIGGKHERREAP